jgi:hypothetical protein
MIGGGVSEMHIGLIGGIGLGARAVVLVNRTGAVDVHWGSVFEVLSSKVWVEMSDHAAFVEFLLAVPGAMFVA